MPNLFAYIALLAWPLVAIVLYFRFPVSRATLWTIVGAQLLLPAGTALKFEMIPPAFDKASISNLAAMAGCFLASRARTTLRMSKFGLFEVLVTIYITSPFITAIFNPDPIVLADRTLPAEGFYDAFSASVSQAMFLIPLFIGRVFLNSSKDLREILRVLAFGMLLYSLPLLFEIRMSPHLHLWVYGYSPSDFGQAMREGSFRPMVFMGHGLTAAFYLMMGCVGATALSKIRDEGSKTLFSGQSLYLGAVLFLCQSLAAVIYAFSLAPIIRVATPRVQMRIAKVIVAIALLYPILRSVDLIPTQLMSNTASLISVERAESLNDRFGHEEALLRRANERFFFGWGRFGRSRIFDSDTGIDMSVTDGRWVMTMGDFGMVGFVAEFGLFALAIFRAASALSFSRSAEDSVIMAALALLISIGVLNLLPNAALLPLNLLMTGSLLGRAEYLVATKRLSTSRSLRTAEIRNVETQTRT